MRDLTDWTRLMGYGGLDKRIRVIVDEIDGILEDDRYEQY